LAAVLRFLHRSIPEEVEMRSQAVTKSFVVALALAGTVVAFVAGARAGALLNGRVMNVSVARVPMPVVAGDRGSPVHTHVR